MITTPPAKGARVAGTINGQAYAGTVIGAKYLHGKCLVTVRFDQPIDVLHGFVSEHRFVAGDLEVTS